MMQGMFAACACLLGLSSAAVAQDTTHIVIAATTDVHGRAYHWNYLADQEAPWGLTRVATVVDSLRTVYPGRVIVADAGDLIQGNPFATFYAKERPVDLHPVVDAMSAAGYDVATPGNHEFNFGVAFFRRAMSAAAFPVVSGNIYRLPRDTLSFPPYVILQRGGARIGVTGFTTPGVMVWDRDSVTGRTLVRPIVPEARRVMEQLSEAGAHLRVVVTHSGMNSPSSYDTAGVGAENVASSLAELPIKPHLVVVGHSHRQMTDSVINGVHFIQARPWAQSVAVAHAWLVASAPDDSSDATDRDVRVVRIEGEEISLANVQPHSVVAQRLERAHQSVQLWVGTPIATSEGDWSAQYARATDTPIIDFVNEVQRGATGAELSATAAFNTRGSLGPGAVRLRDVAAVYPYENTLKVVRISEKTLREYLEQSAAYFHTYRAGAPIINDSVPGFNYDIVSGVSYVVDLSKPVGSRIRQLTRNGLLVEPTDTFTLALNNYRQSGGGGFGMLRGLPVVYDHGESIRDLIADWLRTVKTINAADYFQQSWRIVPPEAEAAARRAFDVSPQIVTETDQGERPLRGRDTTHTVTTAVRATPPLARLRFPATRNGAEHALGRMVADAFRNGGRTQFALVLNEDMVGDLAAGPITEDSLTGVLAGAEELVSVRVTGRLLEDVLERVVASGEIMGHISGLDVWFDPSKPDGERIRRLRFPDGSDVKNDDVYSLTVRRSIAEGGSGFTMLQDAHKEAVAITNVDALKSYLARLPQPVEPPAAPRFHAER